MKKTIPVDAFTIDNLDQQMKDSWSKIVKNMDTKSEKMQYKQREVDKMNSFYSGCQIF